jgi:hypothetical protein
MITLQAPRKTREELQILAASNCRGIAIKAREQLAELTRQELSAFVAKVKGRGA